MHGMKGARFDHKRSFVTIQHTIHTTSVEIVMFFVYSTLLVFETSRSICHFSMRAHPCCTVSVLRLSALCGLVFAMRS